MANGSGGTVATFLKLLFGDVPQQWVRVFLFGVGVAFLVFFAHDYHKNLKAQNAELRKELKDDTEATRKILSEALLSNQAWQEASTAQRKRLVDRFNKRIERLFRRNGWDYEPIEIQ